MCYYGKLFPWSSTPGCSFEHFDNVRWTLNEGGGARAGGGRRKSGRRSKSRGRSKKRIREEQEQGEEERKNQGEGVREIGRASCRERV